jgi:hypothetical protein
LVLLINPVSIIIPHLETPDLLEFVLPLWRHQTVEPYFIIVDTGSPWETCERLEKLRGEDCEIHYIRANGHWHTSGPICHALDLGFSRCLTPFLFSTHVDVFPKRKDFLAWLMGQCNAAQPVLGWQMSPRVSDPREDWKRCVSHTATIFHMPTVRQHRLSYNVSAFYDWYPFPPGVHNGWPDTESFLQLSLDRAGIKPKLLGSEENFELTSNEWFDHARSYTFTRHLWTPGQNKVTGYANQALEAARQRLEQWQAQGVGIDRTPPSGAKSPHWPTLSVIVTTAGRPFLLETLDSLRDLTYDDEVLVAGDGPQPQAQKWVESLKCPFHWVDVGGPYGNLGEVRDRLMKQAAGQWLLFLDDESFWVPAALAKIRDILAQAPRRPHFFRGELVYQNRTIWEEPVLQPGNLVPQMIAVPNEKEKLGSWGDRYQAGYDLVVSTCQKYAEPPIWCPEIVSHILKQHPSEKMPISQAVPVP